MIIFVIERECDDPYYEPTFIGAYSTKELAEIQINKAEYNKDQYFITEVELDTFELHTK